MKLRALVVEDEWAARNYLVELLERGGRIEVVGALTNAEDAAAALDDPSSVGEIDVAFVDLQLAGSMTDNGGLDLVREWSKRPGAPLFVLATASPHHALEAWSLAVADYLLKPFTQTRVDECIARIAALSRVDAARTLAPTPARIVARRKRALVFLRPEEVWAFEAEGRLAFVHTVRGKLDVDLSLSVIEASFGRTLLRVHRNWLINTNEVRKLEGHGSETVLLVGAKSDDAEPIRVPVARERAQSVREALLGNTLGVRSR